MSVLEQIKEMQKQGKPEQEIITELQEQGISPKIISDAISQAQIKSAVSDNQDTQEMNSSIMKKPSTPLYKNHTPATQEIQEQEMYEQAPQEQEIYPQYPQDSQQDIYQQNPQQENYPQDPQQEMYEQAPQEQDTSQQGSENYSDIIIEIAEQVFTEKIKPIKEKTNDINEFKTLAQSKINNISDRLKRIETIIDKLQITILEKIGSYGNNLQSIKKEMNMMQDSFGKVVNQAVAHKSHTTHKTPSRKKTSKKNN